MKTQTLVNASAEIVTIHTLKKGDVYRRLETSAYAPDKVLMGVVTAIGHNGNEAYIQALEFDPNANTGVLDYKSFGTESDLALFGALPEEFTAAAADVRTHAARAILVKQAEADKARANLALLEATVTLALTAPETSVTADA